MAWTGLPDTAVRQSENRIRVGGGQQPRAVADSTGSRSGLSPASVPKSGSGFDLAIAVAVLAGSGAIEPASVARGRDDR